MERILNNLIKPPTHIGGGGGLGHWGNCCGDLGILGALSFMPWLLSAGQFYASFCTWQVLCVFFFFNMMESTAPDNSLLV